MAGLIEDLGFMTLGLDWRLLCPRRLGDSLEPVPDLELVFELTDIASANVTWLGRLALAVESRTPLCVLLRRSPGRGCFTGDKALLTDFMTRSSSGTLLGARDLFRTFASFSLLASSI